MKTEKSFLQVLIGLLVLAAIFFVIERIVGRGRNRAQPVFRSGWLTDVVYWFTTILFTKPFVRLMLILPLSVLILANVTSLDVVKLGTYAGYGPLSRQPIWLQAIQIYLLVDFTAYWTHRLFHRGRWWPFHAVHHSSEDLDWLGSLRVHPVNDLVNKLYPAIRDASNGPDLVKALDDAVTPMKVDRPELIKIIQNEINAYVETARVGNYKP